LILAALAVLVGHERFSPWGCPEGRETAKAAAGRRRGRPPKAAENQRSRPERSLWNMLALAARAIFRALFEPVAIKERRGRPKGRRKRRGRTPKQLAFWRAATA